MREFGSTSAVAKSVDELEASPYSKGRAIVLSEHVEETKATSGAKILTPVSRFVEALASESGAGSSSSDIHATMYGGMAGVVGARTASFGTMNVDPSNQKQKTRPKVVLTGAAT